MKIAFVVNRFPALSETFILNQITGLLDRGLEVDIYANSPKLDQNKQHPEIEKYNLIERTDYARMPYNLIWRGLKGLWLLLTHFHRNPTGLLQLFNTLKYGYHAASLELFYFAIPLLPKKQYDIIHCHFGPCGLRTVLLRELGIVQGTIITTFHGFDIAQEIQSKGEDYYTPLFEQGDYFLPISHHWQQHLIKLGCDEHKISVHHMGIDCNKFSFKQRQISKSSEVRILSIARLVEKKGIEYAIRAVAKLIKIYPNIRYDIIGGGSLREPLQQLIQTLEVGNKINLLGLQPQQTVIEYLNQACIFLAPSVTSKEGDKEGIPVSLMEAMATGLPVVSTYHSGIPELIEDGVSGFLVRERDVEGLVEKLQSLVEHPDIYSKLAQEGRTQVEVHYNIHKLNDQLLDTYRKLMIKSSIS